MKKCIDCRQDKSLEDFHKKSEAKDGRQSRCKDCNRAKARKWQLDNPEKFKEYWKARDSADDYAIKRKSRIYGISIEEVLALLAIKNCQICGREGKLHIDHCHETGKVRGVLCLACNTGLGNFKDDVAMLDKAKQYLAG